MSDIIKDAYLRVRTRKTTVNKIRLIKRYLKMKYKICISMSCLVNRLKTWNKETQC